MKICLKTYAEQVQPQVYEVSIRERLPDHISMPCTLKTKLWVKRYDDYYQLHLDISGELAICCQRCSELFSCDYEAQLDLAVCAHDTDLERLMSEFECFASKDFQINLVDIVTDELHLGSPKKHLLPEDCDLRGINSINSTWIANKNSVKSCPYDE